MVSEYNRYSKYLEEEDVQDQMMDASHLRKLGRAAQGGDQIDEMDDCLYSLDSDPRSARRPSHRDEKDKQAVQGAGSMVSHHENNQNSSQIESVDKSGLSRQSHYTAGNKSSQ